MGVSLAWKTWLYRYTGTHSPTHGRSEWWSSWCCFGLSKGQSSFFVIIAATLNNQLMCDAKYRNWTININKLQMKLERLEQLKDEEWRNYGIMSLSGESYSKALRLILNRGKDWVLFLWARNHTVQLICSYTNNIHGVWHNVFTCRLKRTIMLKSLKKQSRHDSTKADLQIKKTERIQVTSTLSISIGWGLAETQRPSLITPIISHRELYYLVEDNLPETQAGVGTGSQEDTSFWCHSSSSRVCLIMHLARRAVIPFQPAWSLKLTRLNRQCLHVICSTCQCSLQIINQPTKWTSCVMRGLAVACCYKGASCWWVTWWERF